MSVSIAKIKYVQSLRIKKFRQKYNQFIVEGDKAVNELINSGWDVEEVFVTEDFQKEILSAGTFTEVKKADMERLSQHQSPQKALAVVNQKEFLPDRDKLDSGLSLFIDGIQDPGNLGTIIRIADWYAVDQVICSQDSVDLYNHKTIAATMGSFLRIPVVYTELASLLSGTTVPKYACVMDGENLHKATVKLPAIVVIGNEGSGIRPDIINLCDNKLSIPRFGRAESLNASVAAGVVLDRFRG